MIKKSLAGIIKHFKVIEISGSILQKALNSEIKDFEDAVIEVSAVKENADYIVTGNLKDFKKSVIKAISPDELLAICPDS